MKKHLRASHVRADTIVSSSIVGPTPDTSIAFQSIVVACVLAPFFPIHVISEGDIGKGLELGHSKIT